MTIPFHLTIAARTLLSQQDVVRMCVLHEFAGATFNQMKKRGMDPNVTKETESHINFEVRKDEE